MRKSEHFDYLSDTNCSAKNSQFFNYMKKIVLPKHFSLEKCTNPLNSINDTIHWLIQMKNVPNHFGKYFI